MHMSIKIKTIYEHFSEEEIDSIVREKLHLGGLDGTESLMPASLSGGMKKRVSLARAIALNPQIILYDEPTAGLDPIRSTDISALIKRTQETMHVTSVVVTHDLKSAYYVADRIIRDSSGLSAGLKKSEIQTIRQYSSLFREKDLWKKRPMQEVVQNEMVNRS